MHATQPAMLACVLLAALPSCQSQPTEPSMPAAPSAIRPPRSAVSVRPARALPVTTLPWLTLRDHFVATVGEQAGKGQPLGALLVMADATFSAGSRFPLHGHREMEIVSVVVDGVLSHHGDQAHGATLGPRHAQLISARDGMRHAEGNDTNGPVHMLQIWFQPHTSGGAPAYFQAAFEAPGRHVIAGEGGLPLRADARVEWIDLGPTSPAASLPSHVTLSIRPGRVAYVVALTSSVTVEEAMLGVGDGAVLGVGEATIASREASAAVLLIELAAAPSRAP
jgi:redox-sensitive bicupin YhaK (pirin superfamily)